MAGTSSDAPSQPEAALLPSEEDVALYERRGWYVSAPVIPDDALDAAMAGIDAFYRGERDALLPVQEGYANWRPGDGEGMRNNEFVSLQKREVARLISLPVLGAIAARLARTDTIRLLDDQLVYKPPGCDEAVGWHADHAYWGTCSSNRLLTAWIPFQDADEHNGTLMVLEGSHRWTGLTHARHFNDPDLEATERRLAARGERVRRVPMRLKRGQVSFHHCWALHASAPNLSRSPRLALAVHMQDGDNAYVPCRDASGREVRIFDERLCRRLADGTPDFADPAVFPVLWSSAPAGPSPTDA